MQTHKDNLIRIGKRKIQKLGRIALFKDELEGNKLREGDLIEVYIKRID